MGNVQKIFDLQAELIPLAKEEKWPNKLQDEEKAKRLRYLWFEINKNIGQLIPIEEYANDYTFGISRSVLPQQIDDVIYRIKDPKHLNDIAEFILKFLHAHEVQAEEIKNEGYEWHYYPSITSTGDRIWGGLSSLDNVEYFRSMIDAYRRANNEEGIANALQLLPVLLASMIGKAVERCGLGLPEAGVFYDNDEEILFSTLRTAASYKSAYEELSKIANNYRNANQIKPYQQTSSAKVVNFLDKVLSESEQQEQ